MDGPTPYSCNFMPVECTKSCMALASSWMKRSVCSRVRLKISAFCCAADAWKSALASTPWKALKRRSHTLNGVPAGAAKLYQLPETKLGKPASMKVGTSGSVGLRLEPA